MPSEQPVFLSSNIPVRLSYTIVFLGLAFVGLLDLTTLLLTGLFTIFALRQFCFGGRKWLSLILGAILLTAFGAGLYHFTRTAVTEVPEIARRSIPVVIEYAENSASNPCSPILPS